MSLIRYQPWNPGADFQREISRLLDLSRGGDTEVNTADWLPAVDIREEESRFVLHADLPGVKPENVEVTFENGVLTLQGQREHLSEQEQAGYKRIERSRGSFLRRFSLPDTVDGANITAKADSGVLEIVIPKGEAAQPRRISVEH